jgi:hypothetical protein
VLQTKATSAYTGIPVTFDDFEGATIAVILNNVIAIYLDPRTVRVPSDPANQRVIARLLRTVDLYGLGSGELAAFVFKYMAKGAIRGGFYRLCKDLGIEYTKWKTARSLR